MKNLRLCFVALLLTLTLTVSTLAGEMTTVGLASPPPPTADEEIQTTSDSAPATETMLTIIESILSIL